MNITKFYENIALSVKRHRNRLGITQEQLAERSGLSTDYIGKIEACINQPGLIGLFKIINALEVSVKDFFAEFED